MAGNRKLPFGYRMEQGEIKEHPVEAEAVRRIFRRYLAGASYAALVEHQRDTGPAYDEDKPWNKNMVPCRFTPGTVVRSTMSGPM